MLVDRRGQYHVSFSGTGRGSLIHQQSRWRQEQGLQSSIVQPFARVGQTGRVVPTGGPRLRAPTVNQWRAGGGRRTRGRVQHHCCGLQPMVARIAV
jgi:hypothetical protein